MKTLMLDLAEKSYPIYIGNALLSQKKLLNQHIKGQQVFIITNETVAGLYLNKVKDLLADFQMVDCILRDGEQYKNLAEVEKIWTKLLENRCDRNTTLLALGGGVIGDSCGFAAACYLRGVPFIQIPTTLLAQVDSSVGGKTGVNHPLGKNMIGAFWQPKCVLIDIDTLRTLDKREFSAGMAEVIKYGLLADIKFFEFLEKYIDAIMAYDKDLLVEIIYRSCANKAHIVAADELEHNRRALLNLGHTFGHALENASGYGVYLHGEAIAIGMLMAVDLSVRLGYLDQSVLKRLQLLLKKANLPIQINNKISKAKFLKAMQIDKKVKGGLVYLVLLKQLGAAFLSGDYANDLFTAVIDDYL